MAKNTQGNQHKYAVESVTVFGTKTKLARLRHLDPKARKHLRKMHPGGRGFNPRKIAQELALGIRTTLP